ncbi:hypothetical protein HJG60_008910 [Phyllostomus discolor]|uniref:Uncharacterized protein n=1 Tax=Phyllostomus discolor TaxID=89673 RepID=A0A833YMI8_9CHIR|nr:hypothetical protein HJG60_008910 [Phyllostomus discolor]
MGKLRLSVGRLRLSVGRHTQGFTASKSGSQGLNPCLRDTLSFPASQPSSVSGVSVFSRGTPFPHPHVQPIWDEEDLEKQQIRAWVSSPPRVQGPSPWEPSCACRTTPGIDTGGFVPGDPALVVPAAAGDESGRGPNPPSHPVACIA